VKGGVGLPEVPLSLFFLRNRNTAVTIGLFFFQEERHR